MRFLLLLSMVMFANVVVAQRDLYREQLMKILELKHDVEKNIPQKISWEKYRPGSVQQVRMVLYKKAIADIKDSSVRDEYIAYLNNALANDTGALQKRFVQYVYSSPLSSLTLPGEDIPVSFFYKIVLQYIFKQDKAVLPPSLNSLENSKGLFFQPR